MDLNFSNFQLSLSGGGLHQDPTEMHISGKIVFFICMNSIVFMVLSWIRKFKAFQLSLKYETHLVFQTCLALKHKHLQ